MARAENIPIWHILWQQWYLGQGSCLSKFVTSTSHWKCHVLHSERLSRKHIPGRIRIWNFCVFETFLLALNFSQSSTALNLMVITEASHRCRLLRSERHLKSDCECYRFLLKFVLWPIKRVKSDSICSAPRACDCALTLSYLIDKWNERMTPDN